MSSRTFQSLPNLGNAFSLSALSLLLLCGTSSAQAPATEAPAKAKPAAASATASSDVFGIPAVLEDFKQLVAFVEEIDAIEPSGQGEQEMMAHQRKVARTVMTAAEQLSAKKLSDEDALQSIYLKLQALRILVELDEPQADELLAKAIEAAQKDKRPDVQALGMKFTVESGFAQWSTWDETERAALIDKIIDYVTSREPDGSQVNLVMTIVDFLGDMNGEKYALQLMEKTMPHFQTSENPQIQQALTSLKGVERRLKLPGNEIELSGTMLDGSELDWSAYRGKVVLVDFWATWCGPCRAEVPNVLNMYKAYHDKGFDVLGISLDEKAKQAESYIEQTKIPWPTMFSKDPEARVWQNPMAVRYGINGIPRAILVDRDGKVVNMNARGETLEKELRRLLGEPLAVKKEPAETEVKQASTAISEDETKQ